MVRGRELPWAEQRETERPAVFPERERRLGAAVASLFPGEKWRARVEPAGVGSGGRGRGVGQGRPRTCPALCSRAGWKAPGSSKVAPDLRYPPTRPGASRRSPVVPISRRCSQGRAGQWTGDRTIPFSSSFVPFNLPLSNAAILLSPVLKSLGRRT